MAVSGAPRAMPRLGAKVRALRRQEGLSQVQMAERFVGTILGVAVAGVYAGFLPEHGWLMVGIVAAELRDVAGENRLCRARVGVRRIPLEERL